MTSNTPSRSSPWIVMVITALVLARIIVAPGGPLWVKVAGVICTLVAMGCTHLYLRRLG